MEAAPAKVHQVNVSQYDELIPYTSYNQDKPISMPRCLSIKV